MQPYLRPPWTNSCQIWCVRVFHHVLLKYGHEKCWNAKKKIWWCHTSVLYFMPQKLMMSHVSTLFYATKVDDVTRQYSILCHKIWWCHTSVLYFMPQNLMMSHVSTLFYATKVDDVTRQYSILCHKSWWCHTSVLYFMPMCCVLGHDFIFLIISLHLGAAVWQMHNFRIDFAPYQP